MYLQLVVIVALASSVTCRSKDYDDDLGRPYEFGFTIDGQQHRHESKDVNGIIMGEFGFITADGVYHVTVYATDENGLFKILSMKNIKISDRLDLPGATLPKLPGSDVKKEIPTTTTTTTTTPKPVTTVSPPYRFTTVPSLRQPSCSSCSLPSTTRGPPGSNQKFPFQTPQFQPGYKPPPKQNTPGQPPFGNQIPNNNKIPNNNFPNNNFPNNNFPNNNSPNNNYPNVNKPGSEQQPPYNPLQPNQIPGSPSVFPPKPNRDTKPPKVTVQKDQINIEGKPPIPIKDKYPGMKEGLPAGITENDMLDLLYKFNYTIGFHGHYEKGYKNGAKIGGYFVNGRDGISRVVEYIADENGYRPKVKFINLGLENAKTPKEGTEKSFGLEGFEFMWYPI